MDTSLLLYIIYSRVSILIMVTWYSILKQILENAQRVLQNFKDYHTEKLTELSLPTLVLGIRRKRFDIIHVLRIINY